MSSAKCQIYVLTVLLSNLPGYRLPKGGIISLLISNIAQFILIVLQSTKLTHITIHLNSFSKG